MAKDYDKIAQGAGAVDYDALAKEIGGASEVAVKGHTRKPRGFLKELARSQAKNLPVYGGTIGAALGAPALAAGQVEVPVGMAMGGAALGKALEQALAGPLGAEPPANLLDAYGQQAQSAALQGAFEGVPAQIIQPGLKSLGGAISGSQMARALAPAKSLVRNFPTVVQDALRQGASVNKWFGRGGAEAAEKVRRDATGRVVGLLRAATARGEAVSIETVAAPVIAAVEKKAGKLIGIERDQLLDAVQKRADDLLLRSVMGATQRSSKVMSPMMADELRKAAARQARATLTQESMGLPTGAIPDMDRLIAKGAAEAVKDLRGVRAAREAEKTAIGVSRAVRESELRPSPASIGVGLGPVKAGFSVPPGAASRIALASVQLQNPMIASILSTLLRAGSAAVPGPPERQ